MRRVFAVLVFAILWASTANAQTPTRVQNIQDPIDHPYQQRVYAPCTQAGDCAAIFPATTAKRTLVLHASCIFSIVNGGSVIEAVLSEPSSAVQNAFQSFKSGTESTSTVYGINAETYMFFEKGQQPRLDVFSSDQPVNGLACTLSGYYY
jgi:hypothetical protein